MRPHLVVMAAPLPDDDARLKAVAEHPIDIHSSQNLPLELSYVSFCHDLPCYDIAICQPLSKQGVYRITIGA